MSKAIAFYEKTEPKGECVLVLEGRSREQMKEEAIQTWLEISIEEHMEHYLSQDMDKKSAMKQVARDRGISKRDVYQALLED